MSNNANNENAKETTKQYLVDVKGFALGGAEEISDIRLAARLNHEKDQSTDLLRIDVNDEPYVLRIVGDIFIEDGNGVMNSADINADEDTLLRLENSSDYQSDFVDVKLPYFEWITEDGEIASEPFDSIDIDPCKQIERFTEYLAQSEKSHMAP